MTEMIPTTINGKWELLLPAHRAAREQWPTWEYKRLDSMSKNLTKNDMLFYIGGEEGDMAALCAMWGARVLIIEPNEKVLPNIKAIWEANELPLPIRVLPEFAANEDHSPLFNSRLEDIEGEIIGDHGFKQLHDPGDIRRIKIDTLSGYLGLYPTAISLDVEGSEWEVLKGAERVIRNYRPKIWLSGHPEFMFNYYGQYLGDLRQWIKNLGYKEALLDYEHEVHLYYEKN